jgi:tetratricopeptide (TPR) repeat protein
MPAAKRHNLGLVYARTGKLKRAIAEFNTALRIDPGFAPAYYQRGVVYAQAGDYKHAIDDFTSAIALDPANADAHA